MFATSRNGVWLHDFAGFRRACGDRARNAGLELGVADAVLGDLQLGLGIVDLRLRGPQPLLRLVEQHLGGEALRQQGFLAVEGVAGLDQAAFCSRERGLGRPQGVQLILRVELGKHLVGLDAISDIGRSFDDAAADPEGERRFVLGADLAGEHDGFLRSALLGRDGANRPRFHRLGFGLPLAAAQHDRRNRDHAKYRHER